MVGAFAERMKFSAMLWFCGLWGILVYLPVCHMIWGGAGGYLADMGVIDFAGGLVVHITAGVGRYSRVSWLESVAITRKVRYCLTIWP